ncbi:MAG: ATP phosphoribosyltransferase [Acidobacteriota bacterium]
MYRIALPNKGRLAAGARELLRRAGLELEDRDDRALQAALGNDFQALFLRSRDIPEFVADGAADAGITGRDMVAESDRRLQVLLELDYGRCRLVVAAREDSDIDSITDLDEGTRVATSFPHLTREFFAAAGQPIRLVPVSGAAEIAPHLGVAEVIVDLVSTGSTLKINGLKEVATVLESSAVLVSRADFPENHARARRQRELVAALESVLRARDKRYLMANLPRRALDEVAAILPGMSGPTIVDVADSTDLVAAHAVVDRREIYRVIARLKAIGASGILVTKIERLMP